MCIFNALQVRLPKSDTAIILNYFQISLLLNTHTEGSNLKKHYLCLGIFSFQHPENVAS